jgi:hypothetical protein
MENPLLLGKGEHSAYLNPEMANRHGLIAGATGSGKTVTLQVMAENFSRLGIPVVMADVKGDLSGISQPGAEHPKIEARIKRLQLDDYIAEGYPVTFWDVYRQQGHPVRTTISDMGPLLLGRLLKLNDTQQGVLALVFRVADDNGWLLLNIKDLRAMLRFVVDNQLEFKTLYGNVSPASVGAIQRRLLSLDEQGGELLFGEPDLQIDDLLQTDERGYGMVNILVADRLINAPQLYSTLLLWLLAELYEQFPEVGDREKPKLVLFFDEAHLLFDDAPKVLLDKVEQVVRLIRSKGVGVYFVTQNPLDIPQDVLGQLGNRVQHALRAFTPEDQKAVRAAAETFRVNPKLDVATAITQLSVGEALVSTLDSAGQPGVVERVLVAPPRSRIGPVTPDERHQLIKNSLIQEAYAKDIDRESAYEILTARAEKAAAATIQKESTDERVMHRASEGSRRQSVLEALGKSAARSIGTQLGRQIVRGLLGSLFGKR